MWQLKVNGILMPTIYYYIQDVYMAWDEEKARGCATYCEIVPVQTSQSVYSLKIHRDNTSFMICILSTYVYALTLLKYKNKIEQNQNTVRFKCVNT